MNLTSIDERGGMEILVYRCTGNPPYAKTATDFGYLEYPVLSLGTY